MAKAEFSFNDFLKMQSQMKMFGSMDQLLGMIPGLKMSRMTDRRFRMKVKNSSKELKYSFRV